MKEFEFRTKDEFKGWLGKAASYLETIEFKPIVITIKELKDSVSRRQHKYIFGVVCPTLLQGRINNGDEKYLGMDVEDFEMELRTEFHCRREVIGYIDGYGNLYKNIPKRLALGKAHKEEIIAYITRIILKANEEGIYIPPPDGELG